MKKSAKPWTHKEQQAAMDLYTKFDMAYCVEKTGRTIDAIRKLATRLGVKINRPCIRVRKLFAEDVAAMMELDNAGHPRSEIAKCWKIKTTTVRDTLYMARKYGFGKYPKRA